MILTNGRPRQSEWVRRPARAVDFGSSASHDAHLAVPEAIAGLPSAAANQADPIIATGKMVVDLDARSVEVDGQALQLTGREYGILERIFKRSVMRRTESVIWTDKLKLDLETRRAELAGQPLHLTRKEYAILELLSLHKGITLSKQLILHHLYGGVDEPEHKIIDVFVCKLRKKLAAACGGEDYIQTVRGRGFVLRDRPDRPRAGKTPRGQRH